MNYRLGFNINFVDFNFLGNGWIDHFLFHIKNWFFGESYLNRSWKFFLIKCDFIFGSRGICDIGLIIFKIGDDLHIVCRWYFIFSVRIELYITTLLIILLIPHQILLWRWIRFWWWRVNIGLKYLLLINSRRLLPGVLLCRIYSLIHIL